jgi:menaquinone-dependent protoporphyrinogen oxidase
VEANINDIVLVTYASKYGATAEIAEKIGQTLQQAGLQTEVLPAKRVRKLTSYKAVILGSAVYIGAWRNEAIKFLQVHEQALAERPVWIFSSGPAGEGNPVELLQGWRIPNTLQPLINRIQPRDITVFHGNVDMNKANFIEKWMIKNVKSPVGDFRDWNAITAWAESIAKTLKGTSS